MKFYTIDQNNSGGYIIQNEFVDQFVCVEACAYECNFTNTPRTAALWCTLLQHISSASNPATQMQDRQSASDTTGDPRMSEQC